MKNNLRELMDKRFSCKSLYKFHDLTQVSYGGAWRLWSGKGLPDLDTLLQFAKKLDIEPAEFFRELLK